MPPRTAYSPGSRTVEARVKPLSSSHSITPCMPSTLPGATDKACVATQSRPGTRCSVALPVVSSTEGGRGPSRVSRDSAVMRCATTLALGETRS